MIYRLDDLVLDTGRQSVHRAAEHIPLPKLSFDLLLTLVRSAPNLVSSDELMERVWPGLVVSPETLVQRVKLLRNALGDDPRAPRYIASLRSRGYQLVAKVVEVSDAASLVREIEAPMTERLVALDPESTPAPPGPVTLRLWPAVAISVVVVSAAVILWSWRFGTKPGDVHSRSTADLPSIAVLPFQNLSGEPNSDDLVQGVQGQISLQLGKISSLRVISQDATSHYPATPADLSLVAKQLGVGNIIEGNVEGAGGLLRIRVELIEAYGGLKLWEDSYERRSDNIAGVEREVAKAVAVAMQAKLSVSEQQTLASKATRNPEAYDAYLHAMAISRRRDVSQEDWGNVIHFLERAVRLDPSFAAAWALLAQENAHRYFNHIDKPVTGLAARVALENAMRLQPDTPETMVAEGYYFYWVEGNYEVATRVLLQVRSKWPNFIDAPVALGRMSSRQGNVSNTAKYFEEAMSLDPRNMEYVLAAGNARLYTRQPAAAMKLANYALDIVQDDVQAIGLKANIYQALGDLDQADAALARLRQRPGDFSTASLLSDQATYRRHYPAALAVLRTYLAKPDPTSDPGLLEVRMGVAHLLILNREQAAAAALLNALRNELDELRLQRPDDPTLIGHLALVHADLGDVEVARKLADSVFKLETVTRDRARVLNYEIIRARVAALAGDKDRALASLKIGAGPDAWVAPGFLEFDPDWDSLRRDPRFQKLVSDLKQQFSSPNIGS